MIEPWGKISKTAIICSGAITNLGTVINSTGFYLWTQTRKIMPKSEFSFALSDLKLDQVICELRSEPMYLLWDRAGAIWAEMTEKIPGLTHSQVAPNKQVFRQGYQYEAKVDLDRYALHASRPQQSLEEFAKIQGHLTRAVERNLAVEHYKRVGLRVMYAKRFKSKADATKYLTDRNLAQSPRRRCFGVDGNVIEVQRMVKVEAKSKGWSARIYVQEQAFDISVPLNWEGAVPEEKEMTKVQVVLDIDRYETDLLPIGQLDIADWIKSGAHAIRRDADQMIEEYFTL